MIFSRVGYVQPILICEVRFHLSTKSCEFLFNIARFSLILQFLGEVSCLLSVLCETLLHSTIFLH